MSAARWLKFALPAVTTILLILAWEAAIATLDIPSYLIPSPRAVVQSLNAGLIGGALWPHIWATTVALLLGYAAGCVSALVFAALISEFRWLELATYPLIVAFQAVPKVALAPVLVVWFGFELESKVVMVALICFFPCFLNALVGFKGCSPDLINLYRVFGANRGQIFFRVKLPSALGPIFAGLEISIVLALLGVVVSELVASRQGLGHVIAASGVDFNVALMFACVIVLSVMGVLASAAIRLVHRRVAFWDR